MIFIIIMINRKINNLLPNLTCYYKINITYNYGCAQINCFGT